MDWKNIIGALIGGVLLLGIGLLVSSQREMGTDLHAMHTRVVVTEHSQEEHRVMDDARHTASDRAWAAFDSKLDKVQEDVAFIRGTIEVSGPIRRERTGHETAENSDTDVRVTGRRLQ